jgi:hypothetical protein
LTLTIFDFEAILVDRRTTYPWRFVERKRSIGIDTTGVHKPIAFFPLTAWSGDTPYSSDPVHILAKKG